MLYQILYNILYMVLFMLQFGMFYLSKHTEL